MSYFAPGFNINRSQPGWSEQDLTFTGMGNQPAYVAPGQMQTLESGQVAEADPNKYLGAPTPTFMGNQYNNPGLLTAPVTGAPGGTVGDVDYTGTHGNDARIAQPHSAATGYPTPWTYARSNAWDPNLTTGELVRQGQARQAESQAGLKDYMARQAQNSQNLPTSIAGNTPGAVWHGFTANRGLGGIDFTPGNFLGGKQVGFTGV